MADKIKIITVVHGGLLESVYTNKPEAVKLIHYDIDLKDHYQEDIHKKREIADLIKHFKMEDIL